VYDYVSDVMFVSSASKALLAVQTWDQSQTIALALVSVADGSLVTAVRSESVSDVRYKYASIDSMIKGPSDTDAIFGFKDKNSQYYFAYFKVNDTNINLQYDVKYAVTDWYPTSLTKDSSFLYAAGY
jgi:hypothetical protein